MGRIDVAALIGKGYGNGWFTNCHCRYRVFKGARNTKKSYDVIGWEPLMKIMSDPCRNILVIRATNKSNRTSTFATINHLIDQPDPSDPSLTLRPYFRVNKNTMLMEYIPTGQTISFAGMNEPMRITSFRPPKGILTDVYFEEAYELRSYEDFRMIDGTVRGMLPEGSFFQLTMCLNPWNGSHWINEVFFKGRMEDDPNLIAQKGYQDACFPDEPFGYGKGIYLHTGSYLINEFRSPDYDAAMESLRERAPDIYRVEALGMWGRDQAATYPEWDPTTLVKPRPDLFRERYMMYAIGVDFGISDGQGHLKKGKGGGFESATTAQLCAITADGGRLVTLEEYFWTNDGRADGDKKTAPQLQSEIIAAIRKWRDMWASHPDVMRGSIPIYVDCADAGGFRQSLELEARRQGLAGAMMLPSTKIRKESRIFFSRTLMAYGDFLVSEACPNLIRELGNARMGDKGELRQDFDDHAINAHEYAWAPMRERIRLWKDFKQRQ